MRCWKVAGPEVGTGVTDVLLCLENFPNFVQQGRFVADYLETNSGRHFETVTVEEVALTLCSDCGTPPPLTPNQPHDCVNGNCLPKVTYNTPGKYASLAACQSGCAKDSPCTGECIPSTDIAALQQAASKAQANCCK
jgi:hypothetical protein